MLLREGHSLTEICEAPSMPRVSTVSGWRAKDAAFMAEYKAARRDGAEVRFDRAGKIVKEATPANWQVAKLQAEHEYKAAANFCPEDFGTSRQTIEHSGGITLESALDALSKLEQPPSKD